MSLLSIFTKNNSSTSSVSNAFRDYYIFVAVVWQCQHRLRPVQRNCEKLENLLFDLIYLLTLLLKYLFLPQKRLIVIRF